MARTGGLPSQTVRWTEEATFWRDADLAAAIAHQSRHVL